VSAQHPPSGLCQRWVSGIALAGAVQAQNPPAERQHASPPVQAASDRATRYALIRKIVIEWGPYVEATQGENLTRWADNMVPVFRAARTGDLAKAARAQRFSGMMGALLGQDMVTISSRDPKTGKLAVADTTRDLVFTPSNYYCTVIDTRESGMPAAGVETVYDLPNNCGISPSNPTATAALLLNVAVISPTQSGYFNLWPADYIRPRSSTISYTAGQNVQNEIIMPVSLDPYRKIRLYNTGKAHLVVSVTGFFTPPRPAPVPMLSCYNTRNLPGLMDQGDSWVYTPSCEFGYAVGGGCVAGTTGVVIAAHPDYQELAGSSLPPKRWTCLLRKAPNTNFDKYDAYTTCCNVYSTQPAN
jgi:hypothetical protein